jgi:RNA polymerase sigma-70 factor (ECF subfamily)
MSFDDIYKLHYNELRRFGRQFNISSQLIEDLIQETYLRFYLELKKNIVFENPRAWLYKVFINLFKNHLESGKREIIKIGLQKEFSNITNDIHEDFVIDEQKRIVLTMLDQLSEKEKTLLLLYNSGLSYSEMAQIMEVNPASIGQMLVRAIEKLKNELKIHYHEMFEQN